MLFVNLFAILCLIPSILFAKDSEPFLLRYQFPEGKKLIYKDKSYMRLNLPQFQMQIQQEWSHEEVLTEKQEDGLGITVVYTDVSESIMLANQLIPQATLGLVENRPFKVSIEQRGTLRNFEAPSSRKIDFIDLERFDAFVAELELGYAGYYPVLPEEPVSVGYTWEIERQHEVKLPMMEDGSSISEKTKFEIKKLKKKNGFRCIEIESVSEVQSYLFQIVGEMSLMSTGAGTVKSKYLFDIERGIIVSYNGKGEIETQSVILTGSDQTPQKSKVKLDRRFELKKVK